MPDTPSGLKEPRLYSRAELMQGLGLEADEIDRLLAHPMGAGRMLGSLSQMLVYLRSIYDLDERRGARVLRGHHETFGCSPIEVMLKDEGGVERVGNYLASLVYALW